MLQFRNKQKSKVDKKSRLVILRPSFNELPTEIVESILSFMEFSDRQSFRQTSTQCRAIHDQFLEHRIKKMLLVQFKGNDMGPTTFLKEFGELIYNNTRFFHKIAFPQFLNIFLSHRDLMSIRSLHSSVISKISHAQFIGDISDVFVKLIQQYLAVVQIGCGTGKNKFRMLLIVTIITILNASKLIQLFSQLSVLLVPLQNCNSVTMKRSHRSKFYIQFEYWISGGWVGSLWPSNERKSMNLQLLFIILLEMVISIKMNQPFR